MAEQRLDTPYDFSSSSADKKRSRGRRAAHTPVPDRGLRAARKCECKKDPHECRQPIGAHRVPCACWSMIVDNPPSRRTQRFVSIAGL